MAEGTSPFDPPGGTPDPNAAPSTFSRPEWALEKFVAADTKSIEDYAKTVTTGYANLEKAYTQAQQKFGNKDPVPGSPEAYNAWLKEEGAAKPYERLELGDGGATSKALDSLATSLHANGVGPNTAKAIAQQWLGLQHEGAPERKDDATLYGEVQHALGPTGAMRWSKVGEKVKSLYASGQLSKEDLDTMAPNMKTKEGFVFVEKLLGLTATTAPADVQQNASAMAAARAKEIASIQRELADPAILGDKAKFAALQARYIAATKDGELLDGTPAPKGGMFQ